MVNLCHKKLTFKKTQIKKKRKQNITQKKTIKEKQTKLWWSNKKYIYANKIRIQTITKSSTNTKIGASLKN